MQSITVNLKIFLTTATFVASAPALLRTTVTSNAYTLGDAWLVFWEGGAQPSLQFHNRALNRTIFATRGVFVSGSKLSHTASNFYNGCLDYQTLTDVQTSRFQTVTRVQLVTGGANRMLVVSGNISSDSLGSYSCTYDLTLQGDSESDFTPLRFVLQIVHCDSNRHRYSEVALHYLSVAHEAFWGFGEQQDYINMKGRVLPLLNTEHGFGRNDWWASIVNKIHPGCGGSWWTVYMGLPQYLSSMNYSLNLNNQETVIFDLTAADSVQVSVKSTRMEGLLQASSSPLALLSAYSAFTSGRMRRLPAWSQQGAIVHVRGGGSAVQQTFNRLKKHNVSLSALWIEDWTGGYERPGFPSFAPTSTNWVLNTSMYPNWESLKQQVQDYGGAKVIGYVSASFKHYPDLEAAQDVYREAETNGYLVSWCNGSTFLTEANAGQGSALLDVSNERAVEWFQSRILRKEMVEHAGLMGWMADFGERSPLSSDICFHSGEDPFTYHNKYAEVWAGLQTSWMEGEAGTEELLPFVRTGRIHSPGKIRLFWTGDQLTNFDESNGMPAALVAMLSAGLSGFSLTHSDIGGEGGISLPGTSHYTLPYVNRGKTVLLRWMELSTFSAVFRTHLGNDLHANYQVDTDEDTLKHFARFSRFFEYLKQYRGQVIEQEVVGRGWPLMRAMLLHYPNDEAARECQDQFLLGSDILVAPVLKGDEECKRAHWLSRCEYIFSTRSVYLPAGYWVRAWYEHENYTSYGQRFTVEIPYGKPALFWRSSWGQGPDVSAFLKRLDQEFPGYTGKDNTATTVTII